MKRKDKFQHGHIRLAALCRSIALPTRIAIIDSIAKKNDCVIDEIITVENLPKSTVESHLLALKKLGIIKGKLTRGRKCYCVDWEKLDDLKLLFDTVYNQVKEHQQNVLEKRKYCK